MSIYPRGMRCGPLKLLYWPKINRKRGFSRLRVTQWVLSNDPNNSARELTKFRLYLGKRYEPFNSLGLNPTENIMHNMHKSSIKRELPSTAVNSEINRPGVTLHFFRFIGDFEKKICRTECATILFTKLTMLLHEDEIYNCFSLRLRYHSKMFG